MKRLARPRVRFRNSRGCGPTCRRRSAENYGRTLEDVVSIQSEIAQGVATRSKTTLLERDRQRLDRAPTKDPGAHALFLRGRASHLQGDEEGFREAIQFYRQAVEKDPRYALAYAWRAT